MILLHCRWLESEYERAIKSGFFIDFVLKKVSECFVRNVFISGAFIIGEKYIIEGLTKNMADKFIFIVLSMLPTLRGSSSSIIYQFMLISIYLVGLSSIINIIT